jgi:lipopolysaccharide/colanic/teichoic acid biosynthesis glycosyltransferase
MSITELEPDLWIPASAGELDRVRAQAVDALVDTVHRLVALLFLVVLLPFLVGIALAVLIDSRGPVLFRQVRVGRDGREFVILKFRTMRTDAESVLGELFHLNETDGLLFKMRNDPRISRVGHWLRRFSLDELPQLWNVARGDMALVGPRPPLPKEVDQYDARIRRRLDVKPGLTGLWQVSGRSDLPWNESIRLDLQYVEHRSVGFDLQILARTVGAVLTGRGAY